MARSPSRRDEALSPRSEAELAEVIAGGGPFHLLGSGTKTVLGQVMPAATSLSLSRFSGVEIYEPEELILEAGAATPLAAIEKMLAAKNQMLAFETPDFSGLLQAKDAGTLGGLLATGLAGPRRIKAGSVRDHVLAVHGVTGRGEIFKGGARVVKNVTGYDLPKLMAGSWGTLAALTRITFKVLPRPETEVSLMLATRTDDEAVKAMSVALQSPYEVSAAAHVPGQGTFLRLEGIEVSVNARRDALARQLGMKSETLSRANSRKLWASIRDVTALGARPEAIIWRVSVPPSGGAEYVRRVMAAASGNHILDWAGGLVWLALDPQPDAGEAAVRGSLREGHAMLFRAPAELRQRINVFQPQPPALAALAQRVKAAMDPAGKLNPGRMAVNS